ncbi:MAG: hypothetical protein Q8876_02355 [Bacillota bacterium]|nr:hypothetical protein [Bacillota bacterium]
MGSARIFFCKEHKKRFIHPKKGRINPWYHPNCIKNATLASLTPNYAYTLHIGAQGWHSKPRTQKSFSQRISSLYMGIFALFPSMPEY